MENKELVVAKGGHKFYILLSAVVFAAIIFLGWVSSTAKSEEDLGGWFLIVLPTAFQWTIAFVGIGLLIKVLATKVSERSRKHSALTAALSTLAITIVMGISLIPGLLAPELSYLVLMYLSTLFISLSVGAITLLAYLVGVPQPNFWKTNLLPAILTYSGSILLLPFLIGGLNYAFAKTNLCGLVVGDFYRSNCYYANALRTSDPMLCAQLKDERASMCWIGVAIRENDRSLCESEILSNLPSIFPNQKTDCLESFKSVADAGITKDEIIKAERDDALLRRSQRSFLQRIGDFLNGKYLGY